MQIIDPTVLTAFLAVVGLAVLAGTVISLSALSRGLVVTRRQRLARRESILTYYGRLHFAS